MLACLLVVLCCEACQGGWEGRGDGRGVGCWVLRTLVWYDLF